MQILSPPAAYSKRSITVHPGHSCFSPTTLHNSDRIWCCLRAGSPPTCKSPELLEQVRAAAAADDRSVSSWIRRAVEHELRHPA
jgi:hypothetical protein